MDEKEAKRRADKMAQLADNIGVMSHEMHTIGWPVSGQQLANVQILLRDVERRLRNGDDWRG